MPETSRGSTDVSVTEQGPETTPIFAALTEELGLERLLDESPDEQTASEAE
jgi:hypothetical protein